MTTPQKAPTNHTNKKRKTIPNQNNRLFFVCAKKPPRFGWALGPASRTPYPGKLSRSMHPLVPLTAGKERWEYESSNKHPKLEISTHNGVVSPIKGNIC